MRELLVIEDGREYEEFARLFLSDIFEIHAAHSATEALRILNAQPIDALLIDLRFDRVPSTALLAGDIEQTATRLFADDRQTAISYLKENQGTVILAELRAAGFNQPAVFVHDFPKRRQQNLKRLYGEVHCVASFDAAAIRSRFEQNNNRTAMR